MRTQGGHLVFVSAADRNITFQTRGQGQINFGSDNLAGLVTEMRLTRQQLNRAQNAVSDAMTSLVMPMHIVTKIIHVLLYTDICVCCGRLWADFSSA